MGIMTGKAFSLFDGLMRNTLGKGTLLFPVAGETEFRACLLQKPRIAGGMRVMTGNAFTVCQRLVHYTLGICLLIMTCETDRGGLRLPGRKTESQQTKKKHEEIFSHHFPLPG